MTIRGIFLGILDCSIIISFSVFKFTSYEVVTIPSESIGKTGCSVILYCDLEFEMAVEQHRCQIFREFVKDSEAYILLSKKSNNFITVPIF